MSDIAGEIKALCATCKQVTNHIILEDQSKTWEREDYPEMEIDFAEAHWQIIQCKGCETISFREYSFTSEDVNPIDGEYSITEKFYPQRSEELVSEKTFRNVPAKLYEIYREIIHCYNNSMFILCAAGLRAIVEGICSEKSVFNGPQVVTRKSGEVVTRRADDLRGRISGLHEKGILTKKHAEILHSHRFLGNEALHALKQPSAKDLKVAIEIIEHTLENIYEIESKGRQLRR